MSPALAFAALVIALAPVVGPAPAAAGAAALLTLLRPDNGRPRHLLAGFRRWRAAPAWYAGALLLPLALAVALALALSLDQPPALYRSSARLIAPALLGSIATEVGWRGYALPHLQSRGSALGASVTIGVAWWLSTLVPRLGAGALDAAALDAAALGSSFVALLALSVLLTWLWNNTGGSLVLAVLLSASVRMAWALQADGLHAPFALGLALAAAVVAWPYGATALACPRARGYAAMRSEFDL